MDLCHDHCINARNDTIVKSENDNRLYRGLVLSNEMKVLLISDPSANMSAVALDVNIGTMFDPYDLLGLANLCRHILLFERVEYFNNQSFYEYLRNNQGYADTSINLDNTVYKFEIISDKLEDALERFAKIIRKPIFTEYILKRALNIIDLEYHIDLANDERRYNQVVQSVAKYNHPFSRFQQGNLGNKESLEVIPKKKGINVIRRLHQFYTTYYSSNVMSLCILGQGDLDNLEKMVVNFFNDIPNYKVKIPQWSYPFPTQKILKINIVPIKYMRKLMLIFRIPDLHMHYQFKPMYYISHLLECEGKGSLLSVLKIKDWASSLMCEERYSTKPLNLFIINIELSRNGFLHVNDVIYLVFQYFKMLKEKGPVEWIYQEYQEFAEKNFRFLEKSSPISYVTSNARALQIYPMNDVLCAESIFSPTWEPSLINKLLKQVLIPLNMQIHLIAKENESTKNLTESWYGAKYNMDYIARELVRKWYKIDVNPEFHLPLKNKFKVTSFDIKKADNVIIKNNRYYTNIT
ncbi:PREDICTED: insulin-degrading enzyme-like [Dinoponera quadriceps]|uniref:Insulin-degrading enzyme-like n=1 Tax=Dinoponera quadriceps TaxID=609295 RepID=A0A6P3Y8W8_DINQU|nr:PREDICTED: insulin-degrading enzyme-like [Dinoponera quadriceps]